MLRALACGVMGLSHPCKHHPIAYMYLTNRALTQVVWVRSEAELFPPVPLRLGGILLSSFTLENCSDLSSKPVMGPRVQRGHGSHSQQLEDGF